MVKYDALIELDIYMSTYTELYSKLLFCKMYINFSVYARSPMSLIAPASTPKAAIRYD